MKHTPGPWRVCGYNRAILQDKVSIDGCCLAIADLPTSMGPMHPHGYNEANANLIAAAPELLDAAEGMIAAIDAVQDTSQPIPSHLAAYYGSMRAAIAKAEGK